MRSILNTFVLFFSTIVTVVTINTLPAQANVRVANAGKVECVFEADGLDQFGYNIWQETAAGSGQYERIFPGTIPDASGKLTIKAPCSVPVGSDETPLALVAGRKVTVGDRFMPFLTACPPITVVAIKPIIQPNQLKPGLNEIPVVTFPQTVMSGSITLLETWEPNAFYSISLLSNEAQWIDLGVSLETGGDLTVDLVEVTPEQILIQVLEDSTFQTVDDVRLSGLGINVLPGVQSVGIQLSWLGSYSAYLNGTFLESRNSSEFVSREVQRLNIVAVPEPTFTLSLLTLSALGAGSVLNRKLKSSKSTEKETTKVD